MYKQFWSKRGNPNIFEKKYLSIITITIFIFLISNLSAFSSDSLEIYQQSSFDKFLKKLEYPKNIENKNVLGVNYGISDFSYPHKDIISELSNVFKIGIKYGYIRKEPEYRKSKFIHIASETAFISNYSSHMTIKDFKFNGKTSDAWSFGFDYTNGCGYDLNKSGELYFVHSGNIGWFKIDFENYGESPLEQKRYNEFDGEYRFSSAFGTGINYLVFDKLSIDAIYNHSLVFPRFMTVKWLTTSFTELILQRTIDYVGEDYIGDFPEYYPVYNWLAKNAVSMIFYELRRNQMNWYFPTEEPINYDSFTIGLTLVF